MIQLKKELFDQLDGSVEGIRNALQNAIELEHATIPVYLYGLYSLQPGTNQEVAGIIRSVVIEEMLHMSIACNLLNAVGGTPVIDSPTFVPQYPGPLPGGVDSSLAVSLAPLSINQVQQVFMGIEEPERPINFGGPLEMLEDVPQPSELDDAPQYSTIGIFYQTISGQLKPEFFTGDVSRQVVADWWPKAELFAITNIDQARQAIEIVVEQGEGAGPNPFDEEGDVSHYYRFAEIVHGRTLIKNPYYRPGYPLAFQYIYSGGYVPFDPGQVQPLMINPGLKPWPAGSGAQIPSDAFNATYTNLLRSLHAVFNGQPEGLRSAIGIMESLKEQAIALTSIKIDATTYAGPTFQYNPVS